ncbi:MAG: hypothetical protein J4F34_09465, partial [Gemmatimonadetes bacterium]|nr:hypothetical protein [Gemmatimonadota bacterium]
HETDGQLTRWFEDSVFPEGVHPVAGPALADGAMYSSRGDSTNPILHPDSVYPDVVYTISKKVGFKPAVGARIWGYSRNPDGTYTIDRIVTVPEDGIVSFKCRPWGYGLGDAPDTRLVQGRANIASWSTSERHCGQWVQVEVMDHRYLPWRLLNLAADTLTRHFGHTRGRVKWRINDVFNANYYNPATDKITLVWGLSQEEYLHWTAAHEYGHALHHKALGGMWWKRM